MKGNIRVLVVEDDRTSAQTISEIVQRLGFKAVVTAKPADALNVAKLQTLHAAVIDVLLPKMSGVDLAHEFRKTKFADNPVILVSGVFKDRAFAADALTKSGAVDFLFKPFNAAELMKAIENALEAQLAPTRWTVQSLLTQEFKTARDRAKAIERIETIRGLEFPFVLSILTEAHISGHLNIVNENGEIFGVTLARGKVAELDSSESQSTGVLALISNGFLSQSDWEAFHGGKRKVSLERLVQEGLVSPHAVALAKRTQIIDDLKSIFASSSIQVNFVRQDDVEETSAGQVSMTELIREIAGHFDEYFPAEYLEKFYEPIANSAIHVAVDPEQIEGEWKNSALQSLASLRSIIENGGTLNEAVTAHPGADVYKALHYLVLNRFVIFDDPARTQNFARVTERYQKLLREIDGKTPDRVMAYFAGDNPLTPSLVERIFQDYVRANHPKELKDAPAELVALAERCLRLVEQAHAVMADADQRQNLINSRRAEQDERARRATELQVKGLDLLRKGQFQPAVEALEEAERLSPSAITFLIGTWAEVKARMLATKGQLQNRVREIEALTGEERRSVYFHMALGVCKKALGDAGANACFEKVLELDQSFAEARRELNATQEAAARSAKPDLLTGDLSSVISHIFQRKAK